MFTGNRHLPHVLTLPPSKACLLCATPAGMDLFAQIHARRHLPSAVPWISEDRLLALERRHTKTQQRPEWPTVTLTWHAIIYKVEKLHQRYIVFLEDVPVVEFMYLGFTR